MWGKFRTHQEFVEQADQLALSFLLDYRESTAKNCSLFPAPVAIRTARWKRTGVLQPIDGAIVHILEMELARKQHDAVDTAEVVVGIDSALGYESAARGTRRQFSR